MVHKELTALPPRLELFSDAVFAIIITIMVLEMHAPEGADFSDLVHLLPVFLSYVLSFVYIVVYWNNHHHILKTMKKPTGLIMWANAHLLFWISLILFSTAWVGQHIGATAPTVMYSVVFFVAAYAYTLLQKAIIISDGKNSLLAKAVGRDTKGKTSIVLYLIAIVMAFVAPWVSYMLLALVAVIWIVPDPRIEREFRK